MHRLAPPDVIWAPRPQEISSSPSPGRTWLIVYRDNKVPFPQARLDAYLQAMPKTLGQPDIRKHILTSPKDPKRSQTEAIWVYRYGSPRADGLQE